ncbi:bifunctional hydroxymethylpyrimidine kinase/phosphomethylpyrimidine kinase [uncultured Clostridium sp.]|jgi:hydroxymethylpyrimidine/phosphomethylpyrimidine kinase|uniref:bifunctional hydroxymethylpyrimidine kinase/phosphomethylpyrimidine kinase n=1 Tax=uncultured Clostridium sp. TaxID=59620 RepID=UPI002627AED6|nr:bifunctional hydroxymethylpyrimidine kinase/phosphomethylpyrimidine kinase [uncultured Clostridium sp.]
MIDTYKIPTLTIAGSDCSGGAGIQADLKSFSANKTYGMSVITAITAQNTMGVFDVAEIDVEMIKSQIKSIFEDIVPEATKIGMVSSEVIIKEIARSLEFYKVKNLVVDPVMISKSGFSLLKPEAKKALKEYLVPLAYVITPNVPEAEELTDMKIETLEDMKVAGEKILKLGAKYVLVKGGHLEGDSIDLLIGEGVEEYFPAKRLDRKNTHGTGCTLSATICSNLAKGQDIKEAIKNAKIYITEAIANSFDIGNGIGPVHHFYNVKFK